MADHSDASPTPVVFVVDDDEAIREALSLLLRTTGFKCHGYGNPRAFLAEQPPPGPYCVLLDLRMPGMHGLELQQQLRQRRPPPPVIFLTGYGEVEAAVQALREGALDFFEKHAFDPDALVERVADALQRHAQALRRGREREQRDKLLDLLSTREREILDYVAAGASNKVIAVDLGISERTVEIHRSRGMRKLGTRSVAALVQLMTPP